MQVYNLVVILTIKFDFQKKFVVFKFVCYVYVRLFSHLRIIVLKSKMENWYQYVKCLWIWIWLMSPSVWSDFEVLLIQVTHRTCSEFRNVLTTSRPLMAEWFGSLRSVYNLFNIQKVSWVIRAPVPAELFHWTPGAPSI